MRRFVSLEGLECDRRFVCYLVQLIGRGDRQSLSE